MVRASDSSLKPERSSIEPPPRASTMTSTSEEFALNQRIPAATVRTGITLHRGGIDQQIEPGMAAANDVNDVANYRSGRRSDNANALRKCRELAFPLGVKESFGEQAGFELFEGELERSGAARFQGLRDKLELASALIDGDAAPDENG